MKIKKGLGKGHKLASLYCGGNGYANHRFCVFVKTLKSQQVDTDERNRPPPTSSTDVSPMMQRGDQKKILKASDIAQV